MPIALLVLMLLAALAAPVLAQDPVADPPQPADGAITSESSQSFQRLPAELTEAQKSGQIWANAVAGAAVASNAPHGTVFSSNLDSGSLAGDGWTVVNGSQTNQWQVDTGAGNSGGGTTSNAAYVSNSTSSPYSHNYSINNASVVHFYRDVIFPTGDDIITLTFDWKGYGESGYDWLQVFLVPTTTIPAAGTQLSSGQIGNTYNLQNVYTSASITIAASNAGTTQRLVFSWRNDGSLGTQPPAAVDNIVLTASHTYVAGEGVPITYYDFESDSNRATFENLVDQQINAGNSTLTRTGGSGSVYGGTGAGQQFSRGGPATGMALESAFWPATTIDPGTGTANYIEVSLNTSGFTGISLRYDLFTGTSAAGNPDVGTLVSYNGGSSWSVMQSGFSNGNNTWSQQTLALSSSADNNANLRIRFYGYSSDNSAAGVLRLDNVALYATSTTTSAGTKQLLDEPDIYTGTTSGSSGSVYIRTGTITFTGAGTTVLFGSNWAASGTVAVSNSATLSTGGTSGVRVLVSGSSATFTADSGTTLEINSANGITSSGASGNIQTTGTRTFSTGANYVYNGTAAQVTGNGLPATVNHLTINNAAGVTLSQAAAVNGNLTISSGTLDVSASNYGLTVAGNWINNGGFNARSGTVTFNGTTAMSGSSTTSLNNLVINSSKSLTAPSGNLNVAGNWTNNGTFTHNSGTVTFNGTTAQAINCGGGAFYNLSLQSGGAGNAKTYTGGVSCTINNDFTVASTAQLALSTATATTFNVAGNLNYGGVTGGTNIGSLTLNLTGVGKTIGGAALETPAQVQVPDYSQTPIQEINFLTDASRFASKDAVQLENTYAQRQTDVEHLLATKAPDSMLIVNLDDRTIVQNPAWVESVAPTAAPSFQMNVTVADGASYALQDNVSMAASRTLNVVGRLDAGTYTISGAGLVNLSATTSILGTAKATGGVGATVLTTGANVYASGSIVEYNAAGNQVVDAATHPANSMIQTGGSGTKTLNGDKTITGDSALATTKGMIYVKVGTIFADGGYTVSGTNTQYDNVVVYGSYLSTGAGAISFESGPYLSRILAVDGTVFGDLKLNFTSSTYQNYLMADTTTGTPNITFRNITFGGTAGGTLQVNYQGTTPVVVTGNVNLSPSIVSNTGGGFGGTTSTVGAVTVKGNIASSSTNTPQPIFNNTGTNTLIMGGTTAQTIDVADNVTILTGATLRIANGADVALVPTSGTGRAYKLGGTLTVDGGGSFGLGQNTLTVETAVTNNGTIKQTKDVNSTSQFDFVWLKNATSSTTNYYGVSITPASALGLTTVSISGNQVCSQANGYPVKRCFVVNPTTTANSTVTFYYSQAEMQSGQTATSLKAWKYNGSSWSQAGSGTTASSCTTNQLNCTVAVTGVSAYGPPIEGGEASSGPFALKQTSPQAVTLADFSASQIGEAILVTWETVSEINNRGFNLYRGVSPNEPDRQLNDALIPSQSPGGPGGYLYTWEDRADLVSGTTYYYWVEDVDLNNVATRHGPVSVDYHAPTAVRLLDAGRATALPLALPLVGAGLLALAGLAARRRRR
jgi:hypothetical protein